MSTASTIIDQIKYLDKLFSEGGRYTPQELAKQLDDLGKKGGTSIKTVYRLLIKMKDEFHAPIEIDSERRRYYGNDKTVMLPGYIARAESFHFIEIVRNLLETIKETPIYEKASKIFEELSIFAPHNNIRGIEETDSASTRVIFLGAPATEVKPKIWDTIFKAMEQNKHIVIEYKMLEYESYLKRGVRPYQLIFDNGIWDLWGYDCVNKQCQQYNLCRIKSIELSEEYFELPKDYDYRNVTPGTFGCYRDTKKTSMSHYVIHLVKGSYAEIYARDRNWGLNQVVEEDEEGTIISFDNNQTVPILRWILGWGADARPLEPSELVNAWKDEIKKLYKKL